jgi:hypothetical protein
MVTTCKGKPVVHRSPQSLGIYQCDPVYILLAYIYIKHVHRELCSEMYLINYEYITFWESLLPFGSKSVVILD